MLPDFQARATRSQRGTKDAALKLDASAARHSVSREHSSCFAAPSRAIA